MKVADRQSGVPSFIDAMKAVFEPLYDLLKSQPMAFKIDDQIFHCPVERAVTSKRRQLVSTPPSKEMHQDHCCSLISIDEAMAAGDRLHKNRRLARNPSMVSAMGLPIAASIESRCLMPLSPPPSRNARSCASRASASLIR